ncbi:hypothetical protein [Halobacillus salinus]|uniref:hypothetical protein n=1 Tax=Halobacillus salinus TaxID=192814 RepID=UPI0009A8313C|nr:hypothetical protein [Halobacillus salinus]
MARWSEVVKLVPNATQGQYDESGYPIETPGEIREVFANRKSVHSNEFYQARLNGFSLSKMFEVRLVDYENETKLLYEERGEDVEYVIKRTYEKGETIELVCMRKDDEHGSAV